MSRLWTTRAHIFRREIQSHGRFFIVWIHVHPAVCHDGSHGGELPNEMNESTWTPSPRWRHEPTWNHPTSKKKDLIDWSAEKSSSGLILLVHLQVSLIYKMKDYTLYNNYIYIHRHIYIDILTWWICMMVCIYKTYQWTCVVKKRSELSEKPVAFQMASPLGPVWQEALFFLCLAGTVGKLWRISKNLQQNTPWNSKQPFFNGCLVKQPFLYVKIWNHPTETTN